MKSGLFEGKGDVTTFFTDFECACLRTLDLYVTVHLTIQSHYTIQLISLYNSAKPVTKVCAQSLRAYPCDLGGSRFLDGVVDMCVCARARECECEKGKGSARVRVWVYQGE